VNRRVALFFTCVMPVLAHAQTVNSAMIWGGVFGDHRIAHKTALYWDYMPRRAESGAVWQINLGALGITRDLSARWRATAGLGWSKGYRYGAFAARSNTFELRPWLQVTGTRAVGSFVWSDRTRGEFRVIRPVGDRAPLDADWAPTVVRLRRQDRLQRRLTTDARWYAAAQQELLVNVLPARARVGVLEQVRGQLLLGRQLSKFNRMEAGYGLQTINRRAGREMNHTLLIYFRTAAPIR
jgi:Protein of unknown function (DUF2490)